MNKIIFLLTALCCSISAAAQERGYYGFCPMTTEVTNVTAIGTNQNKFVEAAICLDTENDPLVESLYNAGAKIAGVRFYVTNDYKQRSQQRSLIELRQGEHSEAPVAKKVDNFLKGWNEVLFDEPIGIAKGKNFLGYQVYETIGSPYPIGSYAPASIPTACYVNADRQGFISYTNRGTLLIQAIIDGTEAISNLRNAALVSFSGVPTMMVQPSKPFDCTLYIRNFSNHAIDKVEFTATDDYGKCSTYNVELPSALQPYDGTTIPYHLIAPSEEGVHQPLTLHVTKVNGETATPTMDTDGQLYVALDAYERVPLVEEFTSQYCINCPFMAYYLDRALEEYAESGKPYLYVAHHSGFQKDFFTKSPDNELVYLFEGDSYNPAVMYDRRVLKGNNSPIQSAKLAETEPYLTAVTEAGLYPALAEVNIEPSVTNDGKIGVHVSGSVNRYLMQEEPDGVYLSCYLIENNIRPTGSTANDGPFFQYGLNDPDAPADLAATYRFNGVIRNYFNVSPIGDRLTITEGDSYTFDVDYEAQDIVTYANLANCDIVAFVHLIDKQVIQNNFVLNAGSARMQGFQFGADGIVLPTVTDNPTPVTFDLQGRRTNATAKGAYIRNGKIIFDPHTPGKH